MGDESGFDPCECIQGHDSSMRRLLSLLRQSQSYCTDSSCNEEPPVTESGSSLDGSGGLAVAITAAWAAMMVGMYMFGVWPRTGTADEKPNRGSGNNRFDPEPPALS